MGKPLAIVLAAGEGKRMKSKVPKVLQQLCGRTMLGWILEEVYSLTSLQVVVVGHAAEIVRQSIGEDVNYVTQEEQLGTGHAVMQATSFLKESEEVFILCGDTPLLTREDLAALIEKHRANSNSATLLTAQMPDPSGYGRIVRDDKGQVTKIVEDKDANNEEKLIQEINTGSYCFNSQELSEALEQLQSDNVQGEYYLTDVVEIMVAKGLRVDGLITKDFTMALGVNNRSQLAEAAKTLRKRINEKLMEQGVNFIDPESTYIDVQVKVGADTTIYPNTYLEENTVVGEDCLLGPDTRVNDSTIGDSVECRNSTVLSSNIGNNIKIGPYAYIRPGTKLEDNVKIGDFVEIKKSVIGAGSKIPHLTYVGDAEIGNRVNLGAGTIIVNYDGSEKHLTKIGQDSFVGCNSNLIAPVEIGERVFIGAGSTIVKDIPDDALAIARSQQTNKKDMAKRFLKKKKD